MAARAGAPRVSSDMNGAIHLAGCAKCPAQRHRWRHPLRGGLRRQTPTPALQRLPQPECAAWTRGTPCLGFWCGTPVPRLLVRRPRALAVGAGLPHCRGTGQTGRSRGASRSAPRTLTHRWVRQARMRVCGALPRPDAIGTEGADSRNCSASLETIADGLPLRCPGADASAGAAGSRDTPLPRYPPVPMPPSARSSVLDGAIGTPVSRSRAPNHAASASRIGTDSRTYPFKPGIFLADPGPFPSSRAGYPAKNGPCR
jgi:hypothetical protein